MKKVFSAMAVMVFLSGMAFGDSCSMAPGSGFASGKCAGTTPRASAVTEVTKEVSGAVTSGMDTRQARRQQRRGSMMDVR